MQKPTFKNKSFTRKQAFTLIELLIVIAIIGILFIVLVSKVDFATDKAKATGVQTDFRSFQLAFDTVAKENAGFNTFGWDTGDVNQDGKRNSYDEGDNGAGGGIAKNGIQDGTEVFTGHKVYAETFTKVFSLKKAKADGTLETNYDRDALNRLETAINANLDPKLHITIQDDGEIVMANGAQDPWNKEYHGWYITNAETDKADRGAIVMYSDGANGEFGSEHEIANGIVNITVPGNNKNGKDDYGMSVIYTYTNGYGEVQNITTGFSNNQTMLGGNNVGGNNNVPVIPDGPNTPTNPYENLEAGLYETGSDFTVLIKSYDQMIQEGIASDDGRMLQKDAIIGDLVLPDTVTMLTQSSISNCPSLTGLYVPSSVQRFTSGWLNNCSNLKTLILNPVGDIGTLKGTPLETIYFKGTMEQWCSIVIQDFPVGVNELYIDNKLITELNFEDYPQITEIRGAAFEGYRGLTKVILSEQINIKASDVFSGCSNLKHVVIDTVVSYSSTFQNCTALETVYFNKSFNSIFGFSGAKIKELYIDKNCTKLSNSIFISGAKIENTYYDGTIEEWALMEINDEQSNPIPVTSNMYFNNELIENAVFTDISEIKPYTFSSHKFKTVDIGPNVKSIGKFAFWNSTTAKSITLHEGLETLSERSLGGNYTIEITYLPTTLKYIGENALINCRYDTDTFIFGENITYIGDRNFNNCYSQKSIIIYATTPPVLYNSNNIQNTNIIVYVPAAAVDAYKAADVWSGFDIQPIA